MTRARPVAVPLAGLAALLAVTGTAACTSGGGSDDPVTATVTQTPTTPASSAASPPGTASPSDAAGASSTPSAPASAFPADTSEDTEAPAGGPYVFTDVRAGRHDGFDRVVWEFAGEGEGPGWLARYEASPARQGSGEPVDLSGEATLLVLIEGATPTQFLDAPPAGAVDYAGPPTIAAADTEVVTDVLAGAWFEGYQDAFVGVDAERPFRVYRLADPPRVVLEVQHG